MGVLYERDSNRRFLAGYCVDGKDVEEVIRAVIKFYEEKWFHKAGRGR